MKMTSKLEKSPISLIGDIDIDVGDVDKALSVLPSHIKASIYNNDLVKHPCGIYINDVPVDPFTGLCAIPDKNMDNSIQKIDILHVKLLENMTKDMRGRFLSDIASIDYSILLNETFYEGTNRLIHVGNYKQLMELYQPDSIEDIAIIIALIRPAKKYLINKDMSYIREHIWTVECDGQYQFKKSHAVGYAMMVMCDAYLRLNDKGISTLVESGK